MSEVAALSGHDIHVLVFVLAIAVLLGAVYVAFRGRAPEACVIAVVGIVLLLLAT